MNSSALGGDKKRLFSSCDACRGSKTRCLPHAQSKEACQRCLRLGKACVFSEAHGRSKGTKGSSQSKIADVEKRINDIYSLLSDARVASSTDIAQQGTAPAVHTNASSANGSKLLAGSVTYPLTPQSIVVDEPLCYNSDVIQKGYLSVLQAEHLLESFKRDIACSSFILLPAISDLASMRRDHPYLLLSVLQAACHSNLELEENLGRELSETLARRAIVEGNRDLDLLEGLLLCLTWYCNYAQMGPSQLFMFVQMAVSLDLELSIANQVMSKSRAPNHMQLSRIHAFTYLVAASTSKTMRKPVPLRYDDVIRACCRTLQESGDAPLDTLLVQSVQLQSILEDVASTFFYDSLSGKYPSLSTVEISVAAFERRFRDVQASIQSANTCSISLQLAWLHAWAYLYEVAIHIPPPNKDVHYGTQNSEVLSQLAAKHSLLLTRFLEHTKIVMDHYVHLSLDQILKNTLIEKIYLAHTVMLLFKLAFSTAGGTPEDPFPLRKACDVSNYLELIANCGGNLIAGASGNESGKSPFMNSLWHFRDQMLRLKSWYDRIELLNGPSEDPPPDLSPSTFDEIVQGEMQPLDFEWAMIDFMNFDEALFGFDAQ